MKGVVKLFAVMVLGLTFCGCDNKPDPRIDALTKNVTDLQAKIDQLQGLGDAFHSSQSNLEALVRLENSVPAAATSRRDDPYYDEGTGSFRDPQLQVTDAAYHQQDRSYGSSFFDFSFSLANRDGLDLHTRAEVFFLDKDGVRLASEPVNAVDVSAWATNHFSGSRLLSDTVGHRVSRIDVVLEK